MCLLLLDLKLMIQILRKHKKLSIIYQCSLTDCADAGVMWLAYHILRLILMSYLILARFLNVYIGGGWGIFFSFWLDLFSYLDTCFQHGCRFFVPGGHASILSFILLIIISKIHMICVHACIVLGLGWRSFQLSIILLLSSFEKKSKRIWVVMLMQQAFFEAFMQQSRFTRSKVMQCMCITPSTLLCSYIHVKLKPN
jgi:hypothetical protein